MSQAIGQHRERRIARWLFLFLLSLYLITGGGKGYSIDGDFGYEMARTVFLDPQHTYFQRFKTAFARWGALLPLLGQPFVLTGDAVSRLAPERDTLTVDGHTFRIEEWPVATPGTIRAGPLPAGVPIRADQIAIVSFLSNSLAVPQGAEVGQVRVWSDDGLTTLPIRAGVETSEWAIDRPDVSGHTQHRRARLAGHWIGQPRGNLYYARLELPTPSRVTRWELAGSAGAVAGAEWHVRAVAFRSDGAWVDATTGERFWSERETRDFFTHLFYSTLNAFTTAASGVLVYAIVGQLGFDRTVRLVSAVAYGVLTLAWPYAKLDFSEPASTCFTLLAVWSLLRAFPPCVGASVPTVRQTLGLGAVAAAGLFLAVVGKYTAALGAAAVALQWALSSGWWRVDKRRRALAFITCAALPSLALGVAAAALMARYAGETPVVFRNALERLREDWLALPLWVGLRGLLLSPGKSLFLYAPWLLLAPPGAVLLTRRAGRYGVLFALYPTIVVVLYGMKLVWHGGGWGPRYLVPIVPFLAIATAPVIEWARAAPRRRGALAALAAGSLAVQLIGVAKDPEVFASMVREHVVRGLPDMGSRLGGRDYWLARGGDGLARALVDPQSAAHQRGLGYVWAYPTAEIDVNVSEARTFDLSLYFVDWDRQARRQLLRIEDAGGAREWELNDDFGDGVWATWQVAAAPGQPVRVRLTQKSSDTAVVSAMTFDAARGERRSTPSPDRQTRGDWPAHYGGEGYALFAWHSFNVDLARRPSYVSAIDVTHVGDKPDPRIHVEVAEQDLLDTPLLYAAPFSPLLGNAWLLAADAAHLLVPARPDVSQALLARPPWSWAGIEAPRIERPEYGLGLDFWPTLLYTNYASHPGVLALTCIGLVVLQGTLLMSTAQLLAPRWRARVLAPLALCLLAFDWLQFRA